MTNYIAPLVAVLIISILYYFRIEPIKKSFIEINTKEILTEENDNTLSCKHGMLFIGSEYNGIYVYNKSGTVFMCKEFK